MKSMPRLDRLLGSGSLLGLPSSFTGRPYSLTATAVTGADVVHVAQGDFPLQRNWSEVTLAGGRLRARARSGPGDRQTGDVPILTGNSDVTRLGKGCRKLGSCLKRSYFPTR
jgi:hypothetical protein